MVVEDNDVFREALVLLLGQQPGVDVVGDVAGGEEAVELVRSDPPDVVLLDYRLPGMDGVQTTEALRAIAPSTTVVCLTGQASPREAEALREAGAAAVLTKDVPLDQIVTAITRLPSLR